MSNRRRLARERLEIYLVHLLMAYRRLITIISMLMLAYASAILLLNPLLGLICLLPAVYLLLLGNSYKVVVYTARIAAWVSTWGRPDN